MAHKVAQSARSKLFQLSGPHLTWTGTIWIIIWKPDKCVIQNSVLACLIHLLTSFSSAPQIAEWGHQNPHPPHQHLLILGEYCWAACLKALQGDLGNWDLTLLRGAGLRGWGCWTNLEKRRSRKQSLTCYLKKQKNMQRNAMALWAVCW